MVQNQQNRFSSRKNPEQAEIIADPKTPKNTHQILAQGAFGKMTFTIENIPDPNNPKTSRLAILSAIEKLRSICSDDIQVGT